MIKILNKNSVQLCCGKQNCPIVTELANGMVEIVDDDGNKIVVKKEEALLISDGVKTIDEKKLILG
jgi:F0F1-type ATP synthase epsilon subunit